MTTWQPKYINQNKQNFNIRHRLTTSCKVQVRYNFHINSVISRKMKIYECLGLCCSPFPQRYIVATAVLLTMTIMFLHRICFNLAITEMAFRLNITEEHKFEICNITESASEGSKDKTNRIAEFHWSTGDQALLLGIFYIGYIITHLPGGIIADKYSPKMVLACGLLGSGICTLLTPLCARLNFHVLVLLRLVMGLVQGPLFPAQSAFVARWSIPIERNMMNSCMNLGSIIGPMVGLFGSGYLIHYVNSWKIIFYVFGGLTIPFFMFWMLFSYDKASKHPFISERERAKLNSALEKEVVDNVEIQYKNLLTSVPVWAMLIAGFGHDWSFFIILTVLPQYMSYVLLFNIYESGVLLCIPYLCMFVVQMVSPYISQIILTKNLMSKTMQCKVYFFICNQGAVLFFLAATYAKCNRYIVVALFSSAMGILGLIYSCVRVVQVDLAPNLAGVLMGMMNGIGAIGGFSMPTIFAFFTKSNTVEGWRDAFIFSGMLITITTIVFLIFGTSEIQKWNFPVSSQYQVEERGSENVEQNQEISGN